MIYRDDTPELGEFINPYPKCMPKKNTIDHSSKGKLIVLEGLDGSGKSTQTKLLYNKIKGDGYKVFTTNFIHSDFIKPSLLKTKWENCDVYTFTCMYMMGLAYTYSQEIVDKLNEGYIVILDRYVYTIIVKAVIGSANYNWIKEIIKIFRKADITFLIDTPLDVCLERKKKDNSMLSYWECGGNIFGDDSMRYTYDATMYENGFIKYQSAAQSYLKNEAQNDNWYIIDGTQDINKMNEKIYEIVINYLKEGGYSNEQQG